MKKSYHKNYYRNNNQLNKNYDKDFQNMKDSFEMVSSLYNEIQNNLISPNIQISKLKQNYKCFLDEFNRLKDTIEKLLEKKSQNPMIQNIQNPNPYDNTKRKDISIKASPNIKIFQSNTKQLYQTYAIKLETIKLKNTKIRDDIIRYSLKLEDDEKDIPKRNKYLENVANLVVDAYTYSYKLIDTLLKEFHNRNNTFKTIIYERAKEKFSSWVNQTLQIESTQKISFFENNCSQEFISSAFNKTTKDNILLQHFYRLFIDLCILFTETILYSEKDIELKFIKKGERYQPDEMHDITEIRGIKYVHFTVLPGLSVNNRCFPFAKAIVFCESEFKPKIVYNIKSPNKIYLVFNGTIKTKDINSKLNVECFIGKENIYYIFNIQTSPEIPDEDNPVFSLAYKNINSKLDILKNGLRQKIFYLIKEEIPKNTYIYALVNINAEIKYYKIPYSSNQILNS